MNTAYPSVIYESCEAELRGRTQAENVRHMLVRSAFVDEFLGDDRVQELYKSWALHFNIGATGVGVANMLDELSVATACPGRRDLIKQLYELEPARDGNHVKVDADDQDAVRFALSLGENQRLLDLLSKRLDDFQNALDTADYRAMRADARVCLETVGLSWTWLVIEMVESFCVESVRYVFDGDWTTTRWVEAPNPPAQAVTFRFESGPNESAREAFDRFLAEAEGIARQLAEPLHFPEGRMPADLDQELRDGVGRYGTWFYNHRVLGNSINSIAKESAADRSTVRYGLREAERLLSLAA